MGIYRGAGGTGDAVNDASSEATLVQELVNGATTQANNAATSATAAQAASTQAAISQGLAADSATAAASSASSASSSASTATTQATNAATSATAAQTAETAAELAETNAETAETNAETAASQAATSATNASNSASAASTSATNASNSATAAATSATNASNSASAASTSASNASTSATAAAGSASSASTSASNASTSATNAANSATSASTSATTATTQAGIATTQATNAASSASAASTSATNASNSASTATTQATNASNSASSAATSATNAAASYDAFDDRYLGSKSSAPTLDNDGNALLTGALYFDTASNAMKVYNGSAWLDAYASLSGALIATNNLSDLNNTATARTNLGLGTGNSPTFTALNVGAGTVSAPAITTTGDTNTGMYFPAADTIAFTEGGVEAMRVTSNGNLLVGTTSEFGRIASSTNSYSPNTSAWATNAAFAAAGSFGGGLSFIDGSAGYTMFVQDAGGSFGIAQGATSGAVTSRFWINSSGNVGIGTSSPGEKLQVNGNIKQVGSGAVIYQTDNTNTAFWGLNPIAISNSFGVSTGQSIPFIVANANTERMRIDSAGNVGIGTSSPSSFGKLTVMQASGSTSLQIATTTNGAGMYWQATNSSLISQNSYGGVLSIGTTDSYAFNVRTNNTERMRISSAGNVGIGTTSPGYALDVSATGNISARFKSSGTLNAFYLADANTTTDTLYIGTVGNNFRVVTSSEERMRIDSSGNVGIGTVSPTGLLQLTGSSWRKGVLETTGVTAKAYQGSDSNGLNFTSNIYWSGSAWVQDDATKACFAYMQHLGNSRMEFRTAPAGAFSAWTTAMVIEAGGNVGIGLTPTAKLHVGGTIQTQTGSTVLQMFTDGGSNYVQAVGAYPLELKTTGAAPMVLHTNNAERMRIDASGNVALGSTASSNARFTIFNAQSDGAQTVANAGLLFAQSVSGFAQAGIYSIGSAGFAGSLVFTTAASKGSPDYVTTERMRITSTGNVSIGGTTTASATGYTFVNALGSNGGVFEVYSGTTRQGQFYCDSGSLYLGALTNIPLIFNTNNTERMRIDSSGIITATAGNLMLVSATEIASTSGTSIDFTSIPSWVKRVTVMFNGVSTNGTSPPLIQIGDSGGIENTGYNSTGTTAGDSNTTSLSTSTAGFIIRSTVATNTISAQMVISKVSGNIWISSHSGKVSTANSCFGGGDKTLSATLDRVRITTVNGTDTFDAGSINILYE